jgi:hypothetical protein
MDESNADVVLDPDATSPGEPSSQSAAIAATAAPEDRLPTTRLPPITPPPLRPPSVPPPPPPMPAGGLSSRETPTVPPSGRPPTTEGAGRYAMEAVQAPKPSWFRALLTTTSPPPAPTDSRRSVVLGCVLAACAFAAIALILAFRSPPYLEAMPPLVAATVLLTHAMLAIGAGALTYGLLRIAERVSSAGTPSPSSDFPR